MKNLEVGFTYQKKLNEKVAIVADLRLQTVFNGYGKHFMLGIDEDGNLFTYMPDGQLEEGKGYVGDLIPSTGIKTKSLIH